MSLLHVTPAGLYCPVGDFYIDPSRAVPFAIITHAHTDHARSGAKRYLTARPGVDLLRLRLKGDSTIDTLEFGETIDHRGVRISLHPAGHILGSAQVRIEHRGEIWVISGDYKLQPDPTCHPFEPIRCHTFITEATFALPMYRWPQPAVVFSEINNWWRENQQSGCTSVLLAYSLGKAQRLLAGVDATIGPILVHGAVQQFLPAYQAAGISLPDSRPANRESVGPARGRALVIAPPSTAGTRWLRQFENLSTATASGWAAVRRTKHRGVHDRGFVLSDHADWDGLISAIRATGADNILVTHGYSDVLVSWLRKNGWSAAEVKSRFSGEADAALVRQANLFLFADTLTVPSETPEVPHPSPQHVPESDRSTA